MLGIVNILLKPCSHDCPNSSILLLKGLWKNNILNTRAIFVWILLLYYILFCDKLFKNFPIPVYSLNDQLVLFLLLVGEAIGRLIWEIYRS